ncbi:helix-turn-helix transcriptional regulator [Streptomyces chrestomyceticus]|uniref:helix-turn-helix transcriptional regulator n=1 Tax=Streptomyces chrestomyceticus TaxID=68185 RepID=UPI0036B3B2B2
MSRAGTVRTAPARTRTNTTDSRSTPRSQPDTAAESEGRHACPWSAPTVAAQCNVSRSVFAVRFQSTIGMPPLRYATELRMLLAGQWLAQDTLSIQSVAQRLGHTSQAAFSRAFKRATGQPPGASRHTGRR